MDIFIDHVCADYKLCATCHLCAECCEGHGEWGLFDDED
jgi:hypothetical protein